MNILPERLSESIAKISKKVRLLIFIGSNILLAGALFYFLILPKQEAIKQIKSEIEQLDKSLQDAKQKAAKLKDFEAKLVEAEARLSKISKVLPESREIPDLLKEITRLAEEENLKFHLFTPAQELDKGEYVESPVSIEVRGDFHAIARFLSKITFMERLVVASDIDMSHQLQPNYHIVCRLKATTFWLKGHEATSK